MKVNKKNTLPGFPWKGKFEDKKEIDQYFAVSKIQCLICGKWFIALHTHLERTHYITADDYKERYGLDTFIL